MESENGSKGNGQCSEQVGDLPQSYAFTVHFDNNKQRAGGEFTNKFSKRHTRNLSLPISKVYENKVINGSPINGRAAKKAGNHSEGYFSSDPDDDSKPKLCEAKNPYVKGFKSNNAAQDKGPVAPLSPPDLGDKETAKDEETNSDIASEAGTYTIDKDSPEVSEARKSIDTVFGLQNKTTETKIYQVNTAHTDNMWINEWASSVVEHNNHTSLESTSSRNSSASRIPSPVVTRPKLPPMTQPLRAEHLDNVRAALSRKSYPLTAQDLCTDTESYLRATEQVVSALAARVSMSLDSGGESDVENGLGPIVDPTRHTDSSASASESGQARAVSSRRGRLELHKKKETASPVLNKTRIESPKSFPVKLTKQEPPPSPASNFLRKACGRLSMRTVRSLPQEAYTETESYLRKTEQVVSTLAARVSPSLDSGGESDAENSLGPVVDQTGHTDSSASASESGQAKTFRRGQLELHKKKETASTVVSKAKAELARSTPLKLTKQEPPPSPSSNFSRRENGRFSMRSVRTTPQFPLVSVIKKDVLIKKKSSGSVGSARSNSTLSSKEVEFQNWKRRKSYDPMKAAAEGKKKEAAKRQPSSAMTQSSNSTISTPKSPSNQVLRSASFHGTRQLTVSSSDDEEEEVTLSAEDEEWPILQAPRTSLENIPQGSRVSLHSNASNSPTPPLRNRPKLEGVDVLVINALAGISSKLKGSSCNLLNKLKYLYDEDNPKNHQLSAMIDQLEASEPGSPQVKSPSRELAITLRNLKRLESMLKVLDDVLFDEEEFQ